MGFWERVSMLPTKENPVLLSTQSLEEVNKQQDKGNTSDTF